MFWSKTKKVENATSNIADKIRLILDGVSDVVFILDTKNNVVSANKKVDETFDVASAEIVGLPIGKVPFFDFTSPKTGKLLEALGQVGQSVLEIDALDRYKNKIILEARVEVTDEMKVVVLNELSRTTNPSDPSSGLDFLSQVSIRLVELESRQDIYQYAADQLAILAQPACIFINEQISPTQVRAVAYAVSDKRFEKGLKLAGNPVGKTYELNEKSKFFSKQAKILKVAGGVRELSFGKIPFPLAKIVELVAGIKSIFYVGFYWREKLFGTAAIITQKKSDEPDNARIIETFANQVSVTLQRRKVEDDLVKTISELDCAKQKVTQEKDKIDTILHSIADGVFVVDNDFNIILINEIAARLIERDIATVVGKKFSEIFKFVDEKEKKPADVFIFDCIKTGKIQKGGKDVVLVGSAGGTVPVDASASALIEGGKIIGSVVVFHDVTKERQVDQAKSEFVSLASHQLRTPLSSINWYSEMLIAGHAGEINEKQKNFLEEIHKSSKRMVDLVGALLNVSRLELGTFIIEPEPVDFAEISRSVTDEMKPKIVAKNLEVVEDYEQNIGKISADPKLTRIVFQNLVSNSVKYTPDRGKITIKIVKQDNDVLISVADNGFGIPQKQQDQIFTKLFRADNVKSKETEGTGLGLYIVKSIVDHSNGKIWFESAENKGTTFYVRFPLAGMPKKEGSKKLG